MSIPSPAYRRPAAEVLAHRLGEPRRFIQAVVGPRQVGKSTLVGQVLEGDAHSVRYVSADEPQLRGRGWLVQQWEAARIEASRAASVVLVVDEVQKVSDWAEAVKSLWDADTRNGVPLKVVLLGSAPLLVARGLSESLAGRFETIRLGHWSYAEMREAFGFSLEEYVVFGGYPGGASLTAEPQRWRRYVLDSLIETSISRDVLLLTRIDKPALLRQLFALACAYSGQVLSYTKMLGQLQDAGNTTTLRHYLELLGQVGMVCGLPKYAGDLARSRASSPKLQVLNTGLVTAQSGGDPAGLRADPEDWGRRVESAVGAHLCNGLAALGGTLHYWRERSREVDFVAVLDGRVVAIEVKSGRRPAALAGMQAFCEAFAPDRQLLVGADGIAVEEFLSRPVEAWVG